MSVHPALGPTALDAPDHRALAEFYRELLGFVYRDGDEPGGRWADHDYLVLRDPFGLDRLAFQLKPDLRRSTWPSEEIPMQAHVELLVDDIDDLARHCDRARALGAEVLMDNSANPADPLIVLADPAGHPFCLFVPVRRD